ncbi:MAG: maleylpyruvate isomerase family mycothiol-dependent enzyme [Acidimicrobiia bacterium]
MEITEHIDVLETEAALFAEGARTSGLDADVVSCPGWDVRDLVRHLAEIHLWAAAQVSNRATKMWPDDLSDIAEWWPELAVFWPEDDDLIDWYLETNANLVSELRAAPEDLECRTFLVAPSPLAMWARRQAHETAVHRYDSQLAAGTEAGFEGVFAADGVDEMLAAFAPRADTFPIEQPGTMAVHTTDTGDWWHTTMSPTGIETTRASGPGDVTLSGSASDLYLAVWNRGDDSAIDVSGDEELLALWHGNQRVRWSS